MLSQFIKNNQKPRCEVVFIPNKFRVIYMSKDEIQAQQFAQDFKTFILSEH